MQGMRGVTVARRGGGPSPVRKVPHSGGEKESLSISTDGGQGGSFWGCEGGSNL